jgi:magnesium transporter
MTDKRKNRAVIEVDSQLLGDITDLVRSKSDVLLKNILADIYPSDIALIINNLDTPDGIDLFRILPRDTAADVMLELNDHEKEHIIETLPASEMAELVNNMYSDDATDIIGMLDEIKAQEVLGFMQTEESTEVRELLKYEENTAGGIMQKEFIDTRATDTIEQAIREIQKEATDEDHLYHVWVTDENRRLTGIVSLKDIILSLDTPQKTIQEIMNPEVISVEAETDQEEVAKVFQKYDLVSLPVVNKQQVLIGRIAIDDIVDILETEFSEDMAKIVGSDAEELESKSPTQIAMMRLPWVLITLGIEFLAGIVIKYYDDTLSKVILLAAFMPIISAISGNTGLQAAAITVRALATGHASLSRWWEPVKRSFQTSLIIGSVCGIVIGLVGAVWFGKILFGILVGFSMFLSINISGLVGTSIPMVSKRLGFDPAITAGPFETAFQDVVGISLFLTFATMLVKYLL